MRAICTFPGCGKIAVSKGHCNGHMLQRKAGKELKPLIVNRPIGTPPIVEYDEVHCENKNLKGPCHVFRGKRNGAGYGRVSVKYKMVLVHRYVYEKEVGPIPRDKEIDHQCRNRACINIDHLRVVTHRTNMLENSVSVAARNASRTHCPKGHAYDSKNTRIHSRGRACRACDRLRKKVIHA